MKSIKILLFIIPISIFAACSPKSNEINNFKSWEETTPMGWNRWDYYDPTVQKYEIKANTGYLAEHLNEFGWDYIIVDIRWFVENTKSHGYNQKDPRYEIDDLSAPNTI